MIKVLILIMLGLGASKYVVLLHRVWVRKKSAALSRGFAWMNFISYLIGYSVQLLGAGDLVIYFGGLAIITGLLLLALIKVKRDKRIRFDEK